MTDEVLIVAAMKDIALEALSDMVADYLYYDRKDDEELPRGAIEGLIEDGVLEVHEIVAHFEECLTKGLR